MCVWPVAVRMFRRFMTFLAVTALLATVIPVFSADYKAYRSLDSSDPIIFLGDSIIYGGRTITLGERTIFVDPRLDNALADNYRYVYNSIRDAVAHLVDGTENDPMRVLFAPGVYWADDPDTPAVVTGKYGREPFGMVIRCENLHFIGLTRDARNVVLASQRGQTQGAVGNFTMFDFHGDGLRVSNLTMGNFCNVDLDFHLLPSLGRKKRSATITQAHVAYCHGDRVVARNVRFISRLNMNPLNGARRILFDRCHMECTDDALTGNGVYLKCTLSLYGQKPFYTTHRCGAVFLDCDFTAGGSNRDMVFCKAPGQVTLVNCRYHTGDSVYVGWTNYPETWQRCYQAGFTMNGNPYKIGARNPENTVEMDDLPLLSAFYEVCDGDTVYNVYNLLRGDDDWDPTGIRGMVGCGNMGTALVLNRKMASIVTGGGSICLSAEVMRHGGYELLKESSDSNENIHWRVRPGFEDMVELSSYDGDSIKVTPRNNTDETAVFYIEAYTDCGLRGAVGVSVSPSVLPPPDFVGNTRLTMKGGMLVADYTLGLCGRKDESLVTWYRCVDGRKNGAIPVKVSRGRVPERSYRLTTADNGYFIMARIEPKHRRSEAGNAVDLIMKRAVKPSDFGETDISRTGGSDIYETDFRTFPTVNQVRVIPGFWTVDGYKPADTAEFPWTFDTDKDMWAYGRGFNGAVGEGLLQAQRGARLMYTPVNGHYGDMSLTLQVDPTKTAGQGFGSATGQYMDICLKFDTRTLTGYGLRIIRTVKHAKAVDFMLVEYAGGTVTPLTDPVSAICYRTGCTIELRMRGDSLAAHVETSTVLPSNSGLATVVDLSATVTPNAFGGAAIQHTGTCGESTTMLHRLKIEWFVPG